MALEHRILRRIAELTLGISDTKSTAARNKQKNEKTVIQRPAYGFCYAPVTYLIENAFTFTSRHRNSRGPRTANISCERHTTDRQTDGQTPRLIL